MVYNIVFDIDHTLAFHSVSSPEQGNFIHEKGAILSNETLNTHYIYPGALELVKLLFISEEFKVSFFSKGTKERNHEFVRLFLDKAIDEPEYELKKSQVNILSRNDITQENCHRCKEKYFEKYGLYAGEYPKDITKAFSGNELLENAALIDDRIDNATIEQIANFILMPLVTSDEFDALLRKKDLYNSSGERLLKCTMSFNLEAEEGGLVEDGRRIMVYKIGDAFEIKFLDELDKVRIEKVNKDTDLFRQLDICYELNKHSDLDFGSLEDQGVVDSICAFVEMFKGRYTKICRRANRICYVTGLLFAAISLAKERSISLSEALFEYQFDLREDKKTYQYVFGNLVKDDRFYWLGLQKLREVNKNFEFVTPHNYYNHSKLPITDEVRLFLSKAKENEFSL